MDAIAKLSGKLDVRVHRAKASLWRRVLDFFRGI